MVSFEELKARIRDFFRFSRQELQGLMVAILVAGFIFSFRYWGGEQFDLVMGMRNWFWVTLAAVIAFLGQVGAQKIYALSAGYEAEFKAWWAGILISLALCFVSLGHVTLILAGSYSLSMMVRQRLGQFRYGYSMAEQAIVGLWGILGSLIVACLFRLGSYFFPTILFFERGLMLSLILAICSVLPLPGLNGLNIFFGARGIYYISLVVVVAAALLLLLGGGWGLVLGIVLGLGAAVVAMLWGSEI